MKFTDKRVLLCVTGGIAAYKACDVVRELVRKGADVQVAMTREAREFVGPLTFQTLSGRRVATELWDPLDEERIGHIAIARDADCVVVAPATANVMAKMANGIADDLVTTTLLATRAPVVVAPAMNWAMWQHPATRANVDRLIREQGVIVVPPTEGELACGEVGAGRMAEIGHLLDAVHYATVKERDLEGETVLVTAGPTCEDLDPVRFLSNRSSGKMGYAVACEARGRGANVILISGPTTLLPPHDVTFIPVRSAREMHTATMRNLHRAQIVVMTAAVADFQPLRYSSQKIKKELSPEGQGGRSMLSLPLERTPDILLDAGRRRQGGQFIVGFAAESERLIQNAAAKLRHKNLDLIVVNDITRPDAGFGADTNIVRILDARGHVENLPLLPKWDVARRLLDYIQEQRASKTAAQQRRLLRQARVEGARMAREEIAAEDERERDARPSTEDESSSGEFSTTGGDNDTPSGPESTSADHGDIQSPDDGYGEPNSEDDAGRMDGGRRSDAQGDPDTAADMGDAESLAGGDGQGDGEEEASADGSVGDEDETAAEGGVSRSATDNGETPIPRSPGLMERTLADRVRASDRPRYEERNPDRGGRDDRGNRGGFGGNRDDRGNRGGFGGNRDDRGNRGGFGGNRDDRGGRGGSGPQQGGRPPHGGQQGQGQGQRGQPPRGQGGGGPGGPGGGRRDDRRRDDRGPRPNPPRQQGPWSGSPTNSGGPSASFVPGPISGEPWNGNMPDAGSESSGFAPSSSADSSTFERNMSADGGGLPDAPLFRDSAERGEGGMESGSSSDSGGGSGSDHGGGSGGDGGDSRRSRFGRHRDRRGGRYSPDGGSTGSNLADTARGDSDSSGTGDVREPREGDSNRPANDDRGSPGHDRSGQSDDGRRPNDLPAERSEPGGGESHPAPTDGE